MTNEAGDRHVPEGEPRADPELAGKVMAGLDAGVYLTDEQERIIAVNPRAEELLARPAADFLGKDAHDLLHRGMGGRFLPRSQCQLMKAFLGGRTTQGGNKWFARGDGTVLPVVWLITPYELEGGATGAAVTFYEWNFPEVEGLGAEHSATALADLADDLSLLAEITTALTSARETEEALRRLLRLVTPRLADWAIVDLIREGQELRRVAVVHYHEGAHTNVAELEGPLPPVPETSAMPLSRILRGAPATRIGPEDHTSVPDTGLMVAQRELFRRTGMHSAIAAPLRGSRGTIMGALTLGRADQQREFSAPELALVENIARRAGLSVENARLYEGQQRVAETMQRYLLPPMPRRDGLEMAARYQPASRTSEVGGDWYDTFLLPDGTPTLVIGDVVGHDLQAAAHMAEVRSMLRAFAWDREEPPSLIVERLDGALLNISGASMATLIFARLERQRSGTWQLYWSNAGHPPPLLVSRDGQVNLLATGHDVLLGTDLAPRRTDTVTPLPPMTTVLFYTDGLIETPGRTLDEGLAKLSQHAASLARRPLGSFCAELLNRLRPSETTDDTALIALRTSGAENAPRG